MAADLLSVIVYLTPAGTRDEGGVPQPAYLNFDAALLGPPAHSLKVGCQTPSTPFFNVTAYCIFAAFFYSLSCSIIVSISASKRGRVKRQA